jgi:hypothetical protein
MNKEGIMETFKDIETIVIMSTPTLVVVLAALVSVF